MTIDQSAAIPDCLRGVVPTVGSVWEWEPLSPHARETVRVIEVVWNGEEVWITTEMVAGGKRSSNDLSRWVEATVLVAPTPSDR